MYSLDWIGHLFGNSEEFVVFGGFIDEKISADEWIRLLAEIGEFSILFTETRES